MSRPGAGGPRETSLVLKVDIDTRVGWMLGARNLARLFAELKVPATFYVSMGPDNSGRALARLLKPGFLKKQLKSNAAGAYGLTTMLYGWLLPAPNIAQSAPTLFSRLIAEGHEVGLHGWDHVFWHDRMATLPEARIKSHLGRAWRLFREITGMAPASFASPGWHISETGFKALGDMGLSHVSCARGSQPFLPRHRGRALPLLELPTTLPTMDELLGRNGVSQNNIAAVLAGLVKPGKLNVFTLHGEVEGRYMRPALRQMLLLLQKQGVEFITMLQAAQHSVNTDLTAEDCVWGMAEGRAVKVACQASYIGKGEIRPC